MNISQRILNQRCKIIILTGTEPEIKGVVENFPFPILTLDYGGIIGSTDNPPDVLRGVEEIVLLCPAGRLEEPGWTYLAFEKFYQIVLSRKISVKLNPEEVSVQVLSVEKRRDQALTRIDLFPQLFREMVF